MLFYSDLFLLLRDVLELQEAIRIKDAEAEAYISEIEVKFPVFLCAFLFSIFWLFIYLNVCYPISQTDNWSSIRRYADTEPTFASTGC